MIFVSPTTNKAFTQDQIIVRALSSITSDQAKAISDIVEADGPGWNVDVADDYDGYLSILIEPTVGDGDHKALFISGTVRRLELFEAYGDDLTLVGSFSSVEALGARLICLLTRS